MTPDFKDKTLVGEVKLSLASTLRVTAVVHNDDSKWIDIRVFVPIQLGDELMPTKKGVHMSAKYIKELIGILQKTLDEL